MVDKEARPLGAAALREEIEEGRDSERESVSLMAVTARLWGGSSCTLEWNIRAADMSVSSDCQNKSLAPVGDMSAMAQRSKTQQRRIK